MILPNQKPKEEEIEIISKEAILKAQGTVHKGAFFGIVANGGKKSIGNFIIEFVHNGSDFPTVQIYECGLGVTPKVQTWNRTKVVKERVEVARKPKVRQETIKVDTTIKSEDLF
jgi:hypothetical protein